MLPIEVEMGDSTGRPDNVNWAAARDLVRNADVAASSILCFRPHGATPHSPERLTHMRSTFADRAGASFATPGDLQIEGLREPKTEIANRSFEGGQGLMLGRDNKVAMLQKVPLFQSLTRK